MNGLFELIGEPRMCHIAVNGFAAVASRISVSGGDCGDLFSRLLSEAESHTEVPVLGALFEAISAVIERVSAQVTKRFSTRIAGVLLPILAGGRPGILNSLCAPIFTLLEVWADAFGHDFPTMEFAPVLRAIAANGRILCRAFAVNALVRIAGSAWECGPDLATGASFATEGLAAREPHVRALAFDTAAILVREAPDEMKGMRDLLLSACLQTIASISNGEKMPAKLVDSAVVLWLTIVRIYETDVRADDVEFALSRVGFSRWEMIKEVAAFLAAQGGRFGTVTARALPIIAVALLSAPPPIVARIDWTIVRQLAQFAVENPRQIVEVLGGNEVAAERIRISIETILG
jgi:hypothetical protein